MDTNDFNLKRADGSFYKWFQSLGEDQFARYDAYCEHFQAWCSTRDFDIRARRALSEPIASPFSASHLQGKLLDIFLIHALDLHSKKNILEHCSARRDGLGLLECLEALRLLVPLIRTIPMGTF